MPTICLVNSSSLITNADVAAIVTPLNTWISTYVGPAWNVSGTVTTMISPSAWILSLQDTIDQANDLGYHVDDRGRVTAIVDVAACKQYSTDWRTCVGHEVAEMLVDPTTTRMSSHGSADYLVEVCDPVEGQGAEVEGVSMPNFVLPSYFAQSEAPYDWLSLLPSGCPAVLQGGYQEYWNGGWQTIQGDKAEGYMAKRQYGRRAWRRAHHVSNPTA